MVIGQHGQPHCIPALMLFNEAVIHAAEKLSAVLRDCTFVMLTEMMTLHGCLMATLPFTLFFKSSLVFQVEQKECPRFTNGLKNKNQRECKYDQ